MSISDWLFKKKQEKENWEEFQRMMAIRDSSPLPEGIHNEKTGELTCPFCGYELSLTEGISLRQVGAVGETICPKCRKEFKQ
jgi:uncharacterized Zn finger protein (UPF0148 family)